MSDAWTDSLHRDKEEYFDAHIGVTGDRNHLRKGVSYICSGCHSGINFKITQSEFDRFQARLVDKDPDLTAELRKEKDAHAALRERMNKFFESVDPEYLVKQFESMGYTFTKKD